MKSKSLIFSLVCLLLACRNEVHHLYYPDGTLLKEINYHNGILQGAMRSYHPNGVLQEVRHFENGIAVGEYYAYDTLGNIKNEGFFKNECLYVFNLKGNLVSTMQYNGSFPIGLTKKYYLTDNAPLHGLTEFIDNGVKEGIQISLYPDSTIKSLTFYKKDKRDGKAMFFFPNGQLQCLTYYRNGVIDDTLKTFKNNLSIEEEWNYINGSRISH